MNTLDIHGIDVDILRSFESSINDHNVVATRAWVRNNVPTDTELGKEIHRKVETLEKMVGNLYRDILVDEIWNGIEKLKKDKQ